MDTLLKGRMTEAAVLNAFIRAGNRVLVPFGEGQSYDLAVDLDPGLLRVQCKTARACSGGFVFNCRSTDHGQGPMAYAGLADVFGIYFPPIDAVYLVPVVDVSGLSGKAIVRIEPARNNQRAGVRLARDYEFSRWEADALRRLVEPSGPLHAGLAS